MIQLKDVLAGIGEYKRWQLLCQFRSYFRLKKDSLPESPVLRQNALHTLAHLNTRSTNSTEDDMEALDCLEEIRLKKNGLQRLKLTKL